MLSYLELVPRNVLEHIAFLVAFSQDFKPPQDLLNLLLSSSIIYHTLSSVSAPHLYARLFRGIFDMTALRRNSEAQLTDSRLTTEFISRCRLLRRIRQHDASEEAMHEDLCAALRIIVESDGLNEFHLRADNFLQFIMDYVRQCLKPKAASYDKAGENNLDLALWLFALTLSRADVTKIPEQGRADLLKLLRPSIGSMFKIFGVATHSQASLEAGLRQHVQYQQSSPMLEKTGILTRSHSSYPNASSAAILLILVLKEAETVTVQIPPHLPVDRPAALAIGRDSGPTMRDYLVMADYKTALFANDLPEILSSSPTDCGQSLSRSMRHDPDFHQPPGSTLTYVLPGSSAYHYIPALLTGVWEGIYMVLSQTAACACKLDSSLNDPNLNTTDFGDYDFVCKKPMQCSLSIYFCYDSRTNTVPNILAEKVCDWIVSASDFADIQDHLTICGEEIPYERFVPTRYGHESMSLEVVDCIIIGQTLLEHEQAWGGFKFVGRLRRDGLIVMKRTPKNESDGHLGTWIFEGHLRFGAAFIGTWRSSKSPNQSGTRGIFSMGKKRPENVHNDS